MNGHLVLRAGVQNGRTVLLESAGTFPLQVLRAHAGPAGAAGLSLVVLLSGGLLDGDQACIDVVVESGAGLALRTQAATQVHVGRSRQRLHARVGERAWLSYLPHALVPHAGADYDAHTLVQMHSSSRVLVAEMLAPGRLKLGEQFAFTQVRLGLDVRREGELVVRERALVRPDSRVHAAQFGGVMHTSGAYVLGPAEPDPLIEDACTQARAGRTRLARGGWYVRAAANRAAVLDDFLQSLHKRWIARSLPTSTL